MEKIVDFIIIWFNYAMGTDKLASYQEITSEKRREHGLYFEKNHHFFVGGKNEI